MELCQVKSDKKPKTMMAVAQLHLRRGKKSKALEKGIGGSMQ